MKQEALHLAAQEGKIIDRDYANDMALSLRGMTVSYGEKPAIFSIDADFPKGQLCAIIGPNGAGKSTLLKSALGIVPRLSGHVTIFGDEFAHARHRVAYVPQRAGVDWDFPTRVIDVVIMGLFRQLGLLRPVSKKHRERAMSALERVGMADFSKRQIGQLSGGQQQRVFLARALAQEPDLFLLDEPFAGVDAATEKAIVAVLKDLKKGGSSIITVHHDLATVADYFDHVFLVNVRAIAQGDVDATFTTQNLQSAYGGRLAETQIDQLKLTV